MTSTSHPVVRALADEIMEATPPVSMPTIYDEYRAVTAVRLAVAIRDYEARQDAHDYLWRLWTDRVASAAMGAPAKEEA